MALSDFFRINLPYGIKKNDSGEWMAFNREYLPLGCNDTGKGIDSKGEESANEMSLYTKYKGLTEAAITKICSPSLIQRDEKGEIFRAFFYNDATNPQSNPGHWDNYFKQIKDFSKFEIK